MEIFKGFQWRNHELRVIAKAHLDKAKLDISRYSPRFNDSLTIQSFEVSYHRMIKLEFF